jgi:acyl carrier protein
MPNDREDVRKTTRAFIMEEFLTGEDQSKLTDARPLITGGVMDSIATIRLVTHLESRFQITIEEGEVTLSHFNTVDDIVRTVESKLKTSST